MIADPSRSPPASEALAPLCPITRQPAIRHVQWISTRFLGDLWRYTGGVDVTDLLRPVRRLGLWESPVGLMFFDPPIAGDDTFYRAIYERLGAHEKLAGPKTVRREFQEAARHIAPGDRVLDVGCGLGGFRAYLPETTRYAGIDPNFGGDQPGDDVTAESIEDHVARCGAAYDAVCAFQVIEHVPDPLAFTRAMAACLRPGGRLILGVPFWPSPNTTIPNFIINAPPHHVTWWSEGALTALALELGFEPGPVQPVGMSRHEAMIYWMAKVTPIRCRDRFFAPKVSWHVALAFTCGVAWLLHAVFGLPSRTAPNALVMVARKRS